MILIKGKKFKVLTQKEYDAIMREVDITLIPCECGHIGFYFHGTYERDVKNPDTQDTIEVQRIICPECKVTHGLLPHSLIPWSQIPLDTTVCIIQANGAGKVRQILETQRSLNEEDIHNVKKRYSKFWKEREISYGLQYDSTLTDTCISLFGKQFMQINCGRKNRKTRLYNC